MYQLKKIMVIIDYIYPGAIVRPQVTQIEGWLQEPYQCSRSAHSGQNWSSAQNDGVSTCSALS